ncbi:phospholipid methyltransferase-domain-containing protein [Pyronema omphalodes]|nr:phospholipid methyltransferase-domain-containing protein [Pyronema omphalodes]
MATPEDVATLKSRVANETTKHTEKMEEAEETTKQRKTYGRIPHSGQIFVVPQTHDMVSTLLSPSTPKKTIDIAILGVLAIHIGLFFTLPTVLRTPVLLVLFLFWRASYNFGLGYLLQAQSKYGQLVFWAKKYAIFDPKSPFYRIIREDIESKVQTEVKNGDYKFDEAPIEYNTWLVFRRLVDLILMCDFVSYVLMAMSCAEQPANEEWYLTAGRWLGGSVLFLFNLWVKLDAHRVVKDFAWYWGDFFYLIDQNLTFDGVYEIAPHPMYSVGYAGYYGISLFAASYTVLCVSLIAHAAQFAFLSAVENPHIEKTYNPPAPRKKSQNQGERPILDDDASSSSGAVFTEQTASERGLMSLDIFNSIHFSSLLLAFYLAAFTLLTPSTTGYQALFIVHALLWRLWHNVGIGAILIGQSNNKSYVRHFLKFGDTREDAWRNWKGVYFVSLSMTHASFVAAAWKLYTFPSMDERFAIFSHVVGLMLIALQVWTAFSIHESLGEFGWFYGDFFFDLPSPHLTYSGIYRYLNNPERLIGCAGIWGIVLMVSSPAIFLLGLFSHVSALLFLNLVESPHMQKLYGSQVRREAGVAKTIRKAIPPPVADQVRMFQGSVDKIVHEATEFIEELLERSKPRLPKVVLGLVKDTQARFAPARLAIQLLNDIEDEKPATQHDATKYSLNIINAQRRGSSDTLTVPYGEPITVAWTAPKDHSKLDWIGLYKISDNGSREVTSIASMGRWVAVTKDAYDTKVADHGIISYDVTSESDPSMVTGEVCFAGEKSIWQNGIYEFRYHQNGKHHVLAISKPFEIMIEKVMETDGTGEDVEGVVEKCLLPVVKRCFDEKELAPEEAEDEFGDVVKEEEARRIVYAVREMFGVDLAPSVVKADGCVKRLAWRVGNARKVLAPFSMRNLRPSSPTGISVSPPSSPKR